MRELMERVPELSFAPKHGAAHEDVKFQVVVGEVAVGAAKNSAFAAAISAAQDNRLQDIRGNNLANILRELVGPFFEALFEFRAAIDCKSLGHGKAGQSWSVSSRYASI